MSSPQDQSERDGPPDLSPGTEHRMMNTPAMGASPDRRRARREDEVSRLGWTGIG